MKGSPSQPLSGWDYLDYLPNSLQSLLLSPIVIFFFKGKYHEVQKTESMNFNLPSQGELHISEDYLKLG